MVYTKGTASRKLQIGDSRQKINNFLPLMEEIRTKIGIEYVKLLNGKIEN